MRLKERLSQRDDGLQAQGPINLVFLGDSVTHGFFEDGVVDFGAVYHARLRAMLEEHSPFMPINTINAGIGGTTAVQALPRLERDVLCHHPELTVVCFGLNDVNGTVDAFSSALTEIFHRLTQQGTEVIFMTPNMLNTYVDKTNTSPEFLNYARIACEHQLGGKMDSMMQAARECASACGVSLCDCYARWKALAHQGTDTTQLLANRLNHPTRDMHRLFAEELYKIIMG